MENFIPILLMTVGCWMVLVSQSMDITGNAFAKFAYQLMFRVVPLLLAFTCFIVASKLFGWIGG